MSGTTFEVPTNSLSNRLDVTYYLVRAEVERYSLPNIGTPLGDLCTRIRTRTPAREAYVEEGVPCLKLRNVTGRVLNTTNCDFIPERLKPQFVTAKKYDIIITATGEGTAGRADIFLETGNYVVTGENILLRPDPALINPFYLLAVLRTGLIAKQLTHFVRGATGQTHLYWQDIADIHIPKADSRVQEDCEAIFREAWKKRRLSAEKINNAKVAVLKAAGVVDLDVKQRSLEFEITFNHVRPSLRFDVEYYQPIHYTLQTALKKAKCIKANTVAKLNKTTINPRKSPTRIYHYVDISSIDAAIGDYDVTTLYGHEAPTRARRRVNKSDLIVSTVRPNRNAVAVIADESDDLVVSTGFAVITPTSINPLVLFAFLKTEPIYAQIVRKATAAMYPAVTEEDVLDILIPKLNDNQSEYIEKSIRESIALRRQSDENLREFTGQGESILQKLCSLQGNK
jgi:type I restriction enzyme M protein